MPFLKPLNVEITGETEGLERAVDRAGRSLRGIGTAAVAASTAVVGAFGVMAVKGMNAAKSINILAQRANATPEAFQKMAFAARTAGVEQDKLGDILQDVTDRVGEFLSTGSGEMSDFFEKIAPRVGVTAEQFRNLSGPQALQLYVDTLEKAGVNQQQMTFYMEALASDTTTLLPLLRNGGREMRKLGDAASDAGQIISDEMISDLQDANRAMSRVSATIEALEIKIAGAFAPTLSDAADKLDDLLSSADAADAISDMAEAFDGLSEAILSEDFLGAAASGIATVTDLAAGLARGAVTLSDNLELVTTAASAAAVAFTLMGGPLWAIAGALGTALVGISKWREKAEDAGKGSKNAAEMQAELNRVLGVFTETGSPEAGKAAVDLARDNYELAQSALAAAEAELAKVQALEASGNSLLDQNPLTAGGNSGYAENMAAKTEAAAERLNAAQQQLAEAKARLEETLSTVGNDGEDSEDDSDDKPTDPILPGLPGADEIKESLKERLEALQEGLKTENEVLQEWYEKGLQTLQEAREAEAINDQEYKALKEKLEQEHQDRLANIERLSNQGRKTQTLAATQDVLGALGAFNDKAFKMAQIAGAAQALISTNVGAAKALELPFPENLAAMATVMAKGLALVAAIKSGSKSGSGGRASSAGAAAQAAAPAPQRTANVTVQGDVIGRQSGEALVKALNEAFGDGYRLNLDWQGAAG
ncbi:hypothetical protein LZ190_07505 [Rhodovulum sulfidophilum]|nr:hypothetical protein [Rhodovulum sulfidophilum]